MHMKRRAALAAALSCLLFAVFIRQPAVTLAAEKIDMVSITITDAGDLTAGRPIGTLSAANDGIGYTIEDVSFLNDHTIWQKNKRPKVRVELYTEDGYTFSYTSKSHFSLRGHGASFSSARILDSGHYMELDLYLDRVAKDGAPVDYGLSWEDGTAVWNDLGTDYHEVRLYRWNSSGNGNAVVTTQKTSQDRYDFTDHLTRSGAYTFRVRPVDAGADTSQLWSAHSPKLAIDREEAADNRDYSDFSSGSGYHDSYTGPGYEDTATGGASSHSSAASAGPGSSPATAPSASGRWVRDAAGWWYRYDNGGWPFASWQMIDGKWYHFNLQGYLETGWLLVDGSWYYSLSDGSMATGWQKVGPYWYHLSNTGQLVTGWSLINGAWYYLDPASGAMWSGRFTPDGHYVNANGAMLY